MSNKSNLKIRQRILDEAKRRGLMAKLQQQSISNNSQEESTENNLEINNVIDYKNTTLLRRHISTQGRILPRRITGLSAKQQRHLAKSVKRARQMCLVAIVRRRGGQK